MAFFQLFIKSERHLNDESLVFYDGNWVVVVDFLALFARPDMVIYVAPIITGIIGLAIGAASNRYFAKFEYL